MTVIRTACAAMGTRYEFVLIDDGSEASNASRLEAIGQLLVDEVMHLDRQLSLFRSDSLIAHIRRLPPYTPVHLDSDLLELFRDALSVWRDSEGAFDFTLGHSKRKTASRGACPTDLYLQETEMLLWVGGEQAADLDFGAIAKGHALDLAARILREHGIRNAFVHGGTSSVFALGAPPGRKGWMVQVGNGDSDVRIELRDAALSVSVQKRQCGDDDTEGHIVDPQTGQLCPPGQTAVVVGPSARLADAWSTAALVLGHRPSGLQPEYTSLILRPDLGWTIQGPQAVDIASRRQVPEVENLSHAV